MEDDDWILRNRGGRGGQTTRHTAIESKHVSAEKVKSRDTAVMIIVCARLSV